jgi:exopolysaccharide biosynthesis polyprenyl glycosylphosphotransferase
MKHTASLLYSFILLLCDFFALVLAFTLAFIVRVKLDERPLIEPITAEAYIAVVALLLIVWLIFFSVLGLYRSQVYDNRFKEAFLLVVGSLIGILFLIGAEYVMDRPIFPARLVTVYGLVFAFLLTLLFRTLARAIRRSLFRYGIGINDVLIVGSTPITAELAHGLHDKNSGFSVVGIVTNDHATYAHVPTRYHFSSFDEAITKLKHHDINTIVQTELYADQDKNDEILTYAQEHHIAYRFVPGNNRLFVGSIEVNLFQNIPTVAVHQTALIGWGRIVKRIFDIIVSALALILLSPIMVLIYMALVVSGGKAIYKRKRLTRFGHEFTIYKFRSLKTDYTGMDPEQGFTKMGRPDLIKKFRENGDYLKSDPRISQFGRFLRLTSLDELPQLFNVLKGDLSLVGPRALIPEEMNEFHKKHMILSVKSGLTGLAVISGRRNIPFEERRKLDLYYVQNWSFWLDIVIILKTTVHIVGRIFSGKAD